SKTLIPRWLLLSAFLLGLQCIGLHSHDGNIASKTTTSLAIDLLNKKCLVCHGATQTSGLDLRQRPTALKGGTRGPAILPGRPEERLVYVTAAHLSELKMPPGSDSPFPPEELAILKKWILEGAEWPASDAPLQNSPSAPVAADTTGRLTDQTKQ